jgi:hypothetical protein
MIKPYECTQCGSTEFKEIAQDRIQCSFCASLFEVLRKDPQLRINNGARVIFGEHANVEIRGNMEIEKGADVEIQGKITLVKGIGNGEFTLNLIQGKRQPG